MEQGTVKIRMKGLKLVNTSTLKVLPKFEATFDVNGIAEVPRVVGLQLLGPKYPGQYELVEEAKPTLPVKGGTIKLAKPAQVVAESDETKEFAKAITD